MKAVSDQHATGPGWELLEPQFRDIDASRAALGLIALATDRAGAIDFEEFLRPFEGVATFSTRVAMATVATPETLAAMAPHIEAAARLIVPGSPLDAIAYSCTSGTVAIGPDRLREAVRRARPGIEVSNPIDAAAAALACLDCRCITLLVPYRVDTAELVSGYFAEQGLDIVKRATFDLAGDPDMNRLSPECLVEAAQRVFQPGSDALFISCTGLRTAGVVAQLEDRLGVPVVTSNQALAWQTLRLAGIQDRIQGSGQLFAHH